MSDIKAYKSLVERITYEIEVVFTRAINDSPKKAMHFPLILTACNTVMGRIARELDDLVGTERRPTSDEMIMFSALVAARYGIEFEVGIREVLQRALEDIKVLKEAGRI